MSEQKKIITKTIKVEIRKNPNSFGLDYWYIKCILVTCFDKKCWLCPITGYTYELHPNSEINVHQKMGLKYIMCPNKIPEKIKI